MLGFRSKLFDTDGIPEKYFYAPNFEKVEGAYCVRLVHQFVRPLQK